MHKNHGGDLMKKILILFLFTFICVNSSYAGGFQINEHGARAMGMGGAFTAQALDPSAIFFNAAGLSFLSGTNVMLGTTLIFPKSDFTGPSPSTTKTDMVSQIFYPSNLYLTHHLENGFAFGLGVYNPYGLGTEWNKDWVGRKLSVKTDLKTYFINPTVSYQLMDNLSIGVGVSYVLADVDLSFRVPTYSTLAPPTPAANDGYAELKADGSGFNFNVGLLYKPINDLSIGLSYRHSTEIEFSGDAKFTDMQALAFYFPGGDGETTITLPYNLLAGIAYNFTPDFTVELGFQYVGWSSYDSLIVDIAEGPNFPLTGKPLQTDSKSSKDWDDSFLLRFGAEYRFDKFAIRAGFVFDKTPQPDKSVEPMLPDADRNEFIVGFGYKVTNSLTFDLAYQLILFKDRTVTSPTNVFPGTYTSTANLIGVNFSYNF